MVHKDRSLDEAARGTAILQERHTTHLGLGDSPNGWPENPRKAGVPRTLPKYPEATIKRAQGGAGWRWGLNFFR